MARVESVHLLVVARLGDAAMIALADSDPSGCAWPSQSPGRVPYIIALPETHRTMRISSRQTDIGFRIAANARRP